MAWRAWLALPRQVAAAATCAVAASSTSGLWRGQGGCTSEGSSGGQAFDYNWDGNDASYRAASQAGEVVNKNASRFLVLIRHGQYETQHSDDKLRKLTPRGRQQVAASAAYMLQRLGAHPFTAPVTSSRRAAAAKGKEGGTETAGSVSKSSSSVGSYAGVDAVGVVPDTVERLELVTSSMTRALETSSIVLESELGQLLDNRDSVEVMDGIRETSPCAHAIRIARWDAKGVPDEDRPPCPRHGVVEESFFRLFRRPPPSQRRHTVTFVSCHANIIRYFVSRGMQVEPSTWISMQLPHASITIARITKDGRVFFYCIGDSTGQAQQALVTYK